MTTTEHHYRFIFAEEATTEERIARLQDLFAFMGLPKPIGPPVDHTAPSISEEEFSLIITKIEPMQDIGCRMCFEGKSPRDAAIEAHRQLMLVKEKLGDKGAITFLHCFLSSEYVPYTELKNDCGDTSGSETTRILGQNPELCAEIGHLIRISNAPTVARWLARLKCSPEVREALIGYAMYVMYSYGTKTGKQEAMSRVVLVRPVPSDKPPMMGAVGNA